jgi:hypothetical protein
MKRTQSTGGFPRACEAPRPQGGANMFVLYCAPYPAYKAGLAGALPVKGDSFADATK